MAVKNILDSIENLVVEYQKIMALSVLYKIKSDKLSEYII